VDDVPTMPKASGLLTPIGLSAIFVFPSKSNSFTHFLDRAIWLLLARAAGLGSWQGQFQGQFTTRRVASVRAGLTVPAQRSTQAILTEIAAACHSGTGGAHSGVGALQERWRTCQEPRRNHPVENHAAERGTRHERPNGIAPQVMRNVPARMNQPADADPTV
jgi:hypothetical protein